jgi:hypothetical protein
MQRILVMNPDEMIRAAARVMDMNFDPQYKDLIAYELFAQLARENRERAEKQGIGLDSELSLKRCYAVEEYFETVFADGTDRETLRDYLAAYHKQLPH